MLFALVVTAAYLTWGPRPVFGPRSEAAATQVVRGYLEALSRGDAVTALGYALHPPSDASLLTDHALAAQRVGVPISDIRVEVPIEPGRVPVSYRLGTQRVSAVFELTLHDDGWRLNRIAAPADLSGFAVAVLINGAVPASTQPELFPGRYQISAANPRYEVVDAVFDLPHPFGQPAIDAALELSEAGRAEVIEAAQAHLTNCLRQQDLNPPDCGFAVVNPDQTPLDESSVSWSVRGPVDFTSAVISLDHAGSASAGIDLTIRGDVLGLDGSRWQADVHLTRMRADLTGQTIEIQLG